ncbi:MAG: hypothetical protein ACI9KE_003999 [Polyangiales bacterium]|jgi:hypothetical protein
MRCRRVLLQSLLFCGACVASSGPVEPRAADTSGATETDERASAPPNPDTSAENSTASQPVDAPQAEPPSDDTSSPDVVMAEAAPAPTGPPVSPQVLVLIAQMEEDVEAINTVRPFLMRIRTETTLPSEGAPPACRSDLRERIAEMIRRGMGAAASSLGSLRDSVDDLCARFERWETPDERQRSRIARYRATLERIDGWMTDIHRCVDPGPYDFRCENAYGAQAPGDAEQAEAAMSLVREVRGVLVGVPQEHPFPCYSPLWRRVEATTWTQVVARAQIPGLATSAHSLCESIGVDIDDLNAQVQVIRDRLDGANASLIQLSESRQDILLRMRAMNAGATTP